MGARRNTVDDFWMKVAMVSESECWHWTGRTDKDGYGLIIIAGRKWLTHRLSYHLANGTITDGMLVCHKCDVRNCVNPSHLFLGTPADNSADMRHKGRQAMGLTHAWALHPDRVPRGERNGRSKLSVEQVREIKRRLALGEMKSELAKAFGVSDTVIHHINSGKLWRSVQT